MCIAYSIDPVPRVRKAARGFMTHIPDDVLIRVEHAARYISSRQAKRELAFAGLASRAADLEQARAAFAAKADELEPHVQALHIDYRRRLEAAERVVVNNDLEWLWCENAVDGDDAARYLVFFGKGWQFVGRVCASGDVPHGASYTTLSPDWVMHAVDWLGYKQVSPEMKADLLESAAAVACEKLGIDD